MSVEPHENASDLPAEAWLTAIAALDLSAARLRALVDAHAPCIVWQRILSGEEPVSDAARRQALATDPVEVWQRHRKAGVGVTVRGSASYPDAFVDDPDLPAVVFHHGDLDALSGPRVAIVGTRRCTRYGRDVASELGEGLATAGVAVVSGLALGIDAAAHEGALRSEAPAVAVVGSGIDVVYPRANAALWREVAARGLVLTEVPLGGAPVAWRFPARNRLIAALADVVVVVESHERGGSLSTVAEAARRDRPVLAVPGPIRSPASAGTNRLLADGCAPACGVDDVLVALGLSPGRRRPSHERRPGPDADGLRILDALGWVPATLDQLAARSGLGLGPLAMGLDTLGRTGWISARDGWFERVGRDRSVVSDA
ncbi:MAG TPA: DNA-processing protein DprA [Acidimicrobiales bacterium]|jgi:DNA processing protein|nr:DNA-processing protein DprA [Acidimicrobiales bacterium]